MSAYFVLLLFNILILETEEIGNYSGYESYMTYVIFILFVVFILGTVTIRYSILKLNIQKIHDIVVY